MKVVLLLILSVFASAVNSQSIFLTGNSYCSGELEITDENDNLNVDCQGKLVLDNDYDWTDKKSVVITADSIFLSGSIVAFELHLISQPISTVSEGVGNHFTDIQSNLGFIIDKNVFETTASSSSFGSTISSLGGVEILLSPKLNVIEGSAISTGSHLHFGELGVIAFEEPLLQLPSAVVVLNTLPSNVVTITDVPLPAGFLLFLSAMSGLFLFKNKA